MISLMRRPKSAGLGTVRGVGTSIRLSALTLPLALDEAKDVVERIVIEAGLEANGHNVSAAARQLRVSRVTLYRLMHKHGLLTMMTEAS